MVEKLRENKALITGVLISFAVFALVASFIAEPLLQWLAGQLGSGMQHLIDNAK